MLIQVWLKILFDWCCWCVGYNLLLCPEKKVNKRNKENIIERDWNVRLVSHFIVEVIKLFINQKRKRRKYFYPKNPSNKNIQDCVIKVFTSHDVRVNADLSLSSAVLGKCRAATKQRRIARHSGATSKSLPSWGCGRSERHWQLVERLVEWNSTRECRREPKANHKVLSNRIFALLRCRSSSVGSRAWKFTSRAKISSTWFAICTNTSCSTSTNLCGHLKTHHGHQSPRVSFVHM